MSDDLDKLVEQKLNERIAAAEKAKSDANIELRITLAIAGAILGWWLEKQFGGPNSDDYLMVMAFFAFMGFAYEIIQFAIIIGLIVLIAKCAA
ncbi:MAG: hypothetical protein KBD25_03610 [Rickettsiaceae bacterium]|nr:hypothetical protein [Rickettsiaceae bacterium]MCB1657806.1 hypothetical protein [Pseudomonadales bacterium]